MSRLNHYLNDLAKKPKVKRLPVAELVGEPGSSHPVVLPKELRGPATHLWRLYRVMKSEECGVPTWKFLTETQGAKTCFATLVQWLERYRQEQLIVDPVDWIRAHLRYYGAETYPPHLISDFSFDLYRRYLEVKHAQVTDDVTSQTLEKGLTQAWRRHRRFHSQGRFKVTSYNS